MGTTIPRKELDLVASSVCTVRKGKLTRFTSGSLTRFTSGPLTRFISGSLTRFTFGSLTRFTSVEAKSEAFLDRPLTKPRLRCLVEKDEHKTLYLKLKPGQFDEDMLDVESVVVSGLITVTAIYKGHEHPSLLVRVDELNIQKAPPRERRKVKPLCEDD